MEAALPPLQTRTIITETWFSRRPAAEGFLVSAIFTFTLALASVLYWNNYFGAHEWMPASAATIFGEHQFWRAFTALWTHADEKHLISNSFFFFVLGGFLNAYFGYLIFPLLAVVFGAVTNLIVVKTIPLEAHLMGASGIVFWMGRAWLTLYYLIDVARTHRQRLLRSLGVSLVLFFPAEAFDPHTSYLSHLLGFIFGALTGLVFYLINRQKFASAIRGKIVIDD